MLLDVVIPALILGWLLRGRLSNLANIEIRGAAFALLGVAVQYGGQYGASLGWTPLKQWGPLLFAGTFLFLLGVVWLNRKNPALVLVGAGILLNLLVVAANGGKMPVSAQGLVRAGLERHIAPLESGTVITHQLLDERTRLAFLADVIVLAEPYPRPKVISVGDVILAAGVIWCIAGGMVAHPTVTGKRIGPEGPKIRRFRVPV